MRSGFGAKTAKSLSSTSAGKQNIVHRAAGKHSLIRAIVAADILKIYKGAADLAGALTNDDVDPGHLVENQLGIIGGEQLNTSNNTVNANGRLRGSVSDFIIIKRFLTNSEASRLSKALSAV